MRVCILTRGDLFPTDHGAAVKIVRTAEALSRLGAPTFVVTEDRDRYLRFVDGAHEEVPYSPRFRAAEEWPMVPRLGQLSEDLCLRLGYPREELFLYRPMFDPAWWGRAVEVGRKEGIDVFQAEFPGYGVPAAMAARALGALRAAAGGPPSSRPRASVVQHNVEWDRLREFGFPVERLRKIEQRVLASVDEVIAVSADDRRRMVEAGLDADRVSVIPHGVDVGLFRAAARRGPVARRELARAHGFPEDAPLLFFHGTLHYWPNTAAVRVIVEQLLPRLLPRWPALRVLVVGTNPPLYYAHERVIFTGSVPDLARHVSAADVCVCPIEAGGGTRMKLLEYMAAGKPTVSTSKGAEGIAITDEMVLADGWDTFADAVDRLLADRAAAAALGARASAFAARYDWRAIGEAYLSVYRGEGRGEDWNGRLRAAPQVEPAVPVDAHLPPRTPSKPLTLLLLINRGCNLRCSFCDLWDGHEHMPLDRLLPVLDDAVKIGVRTLVITGGEPFLHPDLFRAVAAARAAGLDVNITTNGTRINPRWDELVASGVSSLSFSLDGLEQTHDRLRGQAGAWKKTVAGLERVAARGDIATSVYFTANRENVAELTAVWRLSRERGARFDFWPVNDAPLLTLESEADKAMFRAAVAEIGAADAEVRGRAAYYDEGLAYHAGARDRVRCLGFIDQIGVTYDGRLLPCCVWGGENLSVGNVFERPLAELWKSPEVQAFRESMFKDGCGAGCFNHSLYEFTQSTGLPFRVAPAEAG